MTKLKLFEYITGSQYLWGFKGKWTEEDEKDCFDIAIVLSENPQGVPVHTMSQIFALVWVISIIRQWCTREGSELVFSVKTEDKNNLCFFQSYFLTFISADCFYLYLKPQCQLCYFYVKKYPLKTRTWSLHFLEMYLMVFTISFKLYSKLFYRKILL